MMTVALTIFANRKAIVQNSLHQGAVVFEHRSLSGVKAVRLRPSQSKAYAQSAVLRRFILRGQDLQLHRGPECRYRQPRA